MALMATTPRGALHIAGRWDVDPGRARDGFQDQGCDGGGSFESNELFEVFQGALAFFFFRGGVEQPTT